MTHWQYASVLNGDLKKFNEFMKVLIDLEITANILLQNQKLTVPE